MRKANEEPEATPSLLVDGEDVEQGPEQEVKFDDEEDQAIIDEGIKKSLKRKGIKPVDKEAGMAKKKQKKTRT